MFSASQEYLERGFDFLRKLRNMEALQEIRPEAFDEERNGSILISCGDRDRITDIFSHLREMVDIHTITLNGGGILLADGSFATRRQIILEDCLDASKIKGSTFVKTLGHFPCGKALQRGYTAKDIVLMTLEGKKNIREALASRIDGLRILPLMHVDWRDSSTPEKNLKTYAMQCRHYEIIRETKY